MPSSIRGALLGWYGLILTAVLFSFGAMLYRKTAQAVLYQHDALIESRATAIAGGIGWDPADGWELELSDDYLRAVAETTHFVIWDSKGNVLRMGGRPDSTPMPTTTGFRERGQLREHIARSKSGAIVLVGLSLAEDAARLRGLISSIVIGGLAVLALALLGGWWLANRTMAPIARITDRATRISGSALSLRLGTEGVPRELAGLCHTLNETFARLEEAFSRQTRFTADASHELRTPTSIIRAQIELALSRPRSPEEYRETLETCLRSAQRMTTLVEGLLTLARADGGADRLARNDVPLDAVVRAAAEALRPAAAERQISLHLALSPAVIRGDADRLADVANNLLSNAVRYNRDGGRVDIALVQQEDGVELRVADTGIGIPAEARPKIFERFFRLDTARSRAAGGAGLGLAITKWIVEAHGGTIDVEDNVGGGSVFTVHFPGAPLPAM